MKMSGKKENGRGYIYPRITEHIIADLEKGVRPWVQPWNAGTACVWSTRLDLPVDTC
jgi:antirestriction protein ArdC